jgi:AcrR family transcriptional regulator
MVTTLGLRERKKLDTRRALSDAALQLMFERGIDNVTREAIAGRAGVSLRTFSNYFTGKYEALAYRQTERVRRSIAALRQRPADEPLWTSITEAVLAPVEQDFHDVNGDQSRAPSRAQLVEIRKLLLSPEIRNAMATDLVAAVVGAVVDAAMESYAAADPPVAITTLLRSAFAAVAAGLPAPTPRRSR